MWSLSGQKLASVSLTTELETPTVLSLKQHLQSLCQASRFRQRLLLSNINLEDDETLDSGTGSLQLVVLPFVDGTGELEAACYAGDVEQVECLLQQPQHPDQHGEGIRPVCIAASYGDEKIVELLLEAGAALEHVFETRSPLVAALCRGHLDLARLLLGALADPCTSSVSATIVSAAKRNDVELVSRFAKALSGGKVFVSTPDDGWPCPGLIALYEASKRGHAEIVWLLLQAPELAFTEIPTMKQ